jgi:hypothetical protein
MNRAQSARFFGDPGLSRLPYDRAALCACVSCVKLDPSRAVGAAAERVRLRDQLDRVPEIDPAPESMRLSRKGGAR